MATHAASYVVLTAGGHCSSDLEEGRWPTGDEIAKMSVDSLIMLAGIALASGSVGGTHPQPAAMRAFETFHARYGPRLALIEIGRTRLTNRCAPSLPPAAGTMRPSRRRSGRTRRT